MDDKKLNELKEILESNEDFIGIYQIAKCRTETNIMREFFKNRSKTFLTANWILCGLSIISNILGAALDNNILRIIGLTLTFMLMIFAFYVIVEGYFETKLLNAMKDADDKDEITKLLTKFMEKRREKK